MATLLAVLCFVLGSAAGWAVTHYLLP
jgi:hypothetical protein